MLHQMEMQVQQPDEVDKEAGKVCALSAGHERGPARADGMDGTVGNAEVNSVAAASGSEPLAGNIQEVSGSTSVDAALFPNAAEVGDYIDVYWPIDNLFYAGRVTRFYARSGQHLVEYLDGDQELLDLSREIWCHIDPPDSVAPN